MTHLETRSAFKQATAPHTAQPALGSIFNLKLNNYQRSTTDAYDAYRRAGGDMGDERLCGGFVHAKKAKS